MLALDTGMNFRLLRLAIGKRLATLATCPVFGEYYSYPLVDSNISC